MDLNKLQLKLDELNWYIENTQKCLSVSKNPEDIKTQEEYLEIFNDSKELVQKCIDKILLEQKEAS